MCISKTEHLSRSDWIMITWLIVNSDETTCMCEFAYNRTLIFHSCVAIDIHGNEIDDEVD